MIKKTYTAKSVVSIRVALSYGVTALIAFRPLIDGGSEFVTTDTSLQNALENHQKYNKLFVLDGEEIVSDAITDPKPSYYDKESNVGNVITFDKQNLTEQEKAQARENIGAATEPTELQHVLRYSEQDLSEEGKAQARANIGAFNYPVITDDEMDEVLTLEEENN